MIVLPLIWLAIAMASGLAACGGGSDGDTRAATAATPRPLATSAPSDDNPVTEDQLVEVGGHKLFIACRGTRGPTVVYLHGMGGSAAGAGEIPEKLDESQRFCAYDRINSYGISDQVEGPLTGNDQVADLHGLLAAAHVPGPYVLLGASHGGLLASMYAGTHPEDVAGMVLLDAPLADIFEYEGPYLPKSFRPKPGDWKDSPEKVDDIATFRQAKALQGNEPKVPATYLAANGTDLPASLPRAKIVAADRRMARDFLKAFSPGRLVLVDSPHYMEPEIPGQIAREVERVVAASAAS